MPPLYGEGTNAFLRLQQAILQTSDDESIFAWQWYGGESGLLAPSPAAFQGCGNIVPSGTFDSDRAPYYMTNKGLRMECFLVPSSDTPAGQVFTEQGELLATSVFMPLNYKWEEDGFNMVAIHMSRKFGDRFVRINTHRLIEWGGWSLSPWGSFDIEQARRQLRLKTLVIHVKKGNQLGLLSKPDPYQFDINLDCDHEHGFIPKKVCCSCDRHIIWEPSQTCDECHMWNGETKGLIFERNDLETGDPERFVVTIGASFNTAGIGLFHIADWNQKDWYGSVCRYPRWMSRTQIGLNEQSIRLPTGQRVSVTLEKRGNTQNGSKQYTVSISISSAVHSYPEASNVGVYEIY